MDARIAKVAEMEEKGFWACENGHEIQFTKDGEPAEQIPGDTNFCPQCGKATKLVKRSEMSGQEKYEFDKDRKAAEKIAAAKRDEIAAQEKELENQEATAKYFRGQAQSSRALAENLRKV
jgi:uncharacterized Zn finger protein (UPF0148 family)